MDEWRDGRKHKLINEWMMNEKVRDGWTGGCSDGWMHPNKWMDRWILINGCNKEWLEEQMDGDMN